MSRYLFCIFFVLLAASITLADKGEHLSRACQTFINECQHMSSLAPLADRKSIQELCQKKVDDEGWCSNPIKCFEPCVKDCTDSGQKGFGWLNCVESCPDCALSVPGVCGNLMSQCRLHTKYAAPENQEALRGFCAILENTVDECTELTKHNEQCYTECYNRCATHSIHKESWPNCMMGCHSCLVSSSGKSEEHHDKKPKHGDKKGSHHGGNNGKKDHKKGHNEKKPKEHVNSAEGSKICATLQIQCQTTLSKSSEFDKGRSQVNCDRNQVDCVDQVAGNIPCYTTCVEGCANRGNIYDWDVCNKTCTAKCSICPGIIDSCEKAVANSGGAEKQVCEKLNKTGSGCVEDIMVNPFAVDHHCWDKCHDKTKSFDKWVKCVKKCFDKRDKANNVGELCGRIAAHCLETASHSSSDVRDGETAKCKEMDLNKCHLEAFNTLKCMDKCENKCFENHNQNHTGWASCFEGCGGSNCNTITNHDEKDEDENEAPVHVSNNHNNKPKEHKPRKPVQICEDVIDDCEDLANTGRESLKDETEKKCDELREDRIRCVEDVSQNVECFDKCLSVCTQVDDLNGWSLCLTGCQTCLPSNYSAYADVCDSFIDLCYSDVSNLTDLEKGERKKECDHMKDDFPVCIETLSTNPCKSKCIQRCPTEHYTTWKACTLDCNCSSTTSNNTKPVEAQKLTAEAVCKNVVESCISQLTTTPQDKKALGDETCKTMKKKGNAACIREVKGREACYNTCNLTCMKNSKGDVEVWSACLEKKCEKCPISP